MNSFVMFRSFFKGMKNLDDHSWRQMVEAIAAYSMDGVEPELPDHLVMAFEFARPEIDKTIKMRALGSAGGKSKKRLQAENDSTETRLQAETKNTDLRLQAETAQPETRLQADDNTLKSEPESPAEDPSLERARTRINNNNIYNTSSPNSYSITENNTKGLDKEGVKDREYEGKGTQTTRHRYGTYGNVLLSDQEMEKLRSEFPDWEEWIRKVDNYTQSSGKRYKDYLAVIRNWARRDSEQRTRSGPLNNFTDTGSTDLDRVLEEHRQRMIDRVASITGGAT